MVRLQSMRSPVEHRRPAVADSFRPRWARAEAHLINADWWARVVEARATHDDRLPRRVWTPRKGASKAAIDLRAVPGVVAAVGPGRSVHLPLPPAVRLAVAVRCCASQPRGLRRAECSRSVSLCQAVVPRLQVAEAETRKPQPPPATLRCGWPRGCRKRVVLRSSIECLGARLRRPKRRHCPLRSTRQAAVRVPTLAPHNR